MNELSNKFQTELSGLSKSLQSHFETMRKFQSPLEKVLSKFPTIPKPTGFDEIVKFNEVFRNSLHEQLKPLTELQNSFKNVIDSGFTRLREALDGLPPRVQEGIKKLSEQSWFFDQNMDLDLLLSVDDDEFEKLEFELVKHYQSNLKTIEKFLTKNYPNRRNFFRAIFKAHRERQYELSIPVIFTQVDGMCKEVTGEYIFMSRDRKPRTSEYIETLTIDAFTEALLSPFNEKTSVLHSEKERGSRLLLNRHVVLHGDSVDYPNKLNSLKAISMLTYVGQMLIDLKEEETTS